MAIKERPCKFSAAGCVVIQVTDQEPATCGWIASSVQESFEALLETGLSATREYGSDLVPFREQEMTKRGHVCLTFADDVDVSHGQAPRSSTS